MKQNQVVRILEITTSAVPRGVRAATFEENLVLLVVAMEHGRALVSPRLIVSLVQRTVREEP